LKKKRLRSRASGEIGLHPASAAEVYVSYVSGVQIAIDLGADDVVSGEAANTTPAASAARNFAGTVSRCFASSACSKVPRKIKGSHASERNLNPGGWVGGALPPGFRDA
jgi:hypothetical protein